MTNRHSGLQHRDVSTGHDPCDGVSATGAIVTGVHRSEVTPDFELIIQAAIDRVSVMPEQVGLYAYGFVATGMARLGRSDVDLIAVGPQPEVAKAVSAELSARYGHLCRGVELGAAQEAHYLRGDDEAYGNRVFLRHYAAHLAGPDVRTQLADFKAEYAVDAAVARGFSGDIALAAQRWRYSSQADPVPPTLGRRVARNTRVAVAGLCQRARRDLDHRPYRRGAAVGHPETRTRKCLGRTRFLGH